MRQLIVHEPLATLVGSHLYRLYIAGIAFTIDEHDVIRIESRGLYIAAAADASNDAAAGNRITGSGSKRALPRTIHQDRSERL